MGHKTLIGGTAYDIKGGKTLIGGTGYDIKKGRTLIGGTGYDISFGTSLGELAVKTSVYMNVDGVRTEWKVAHQGIPNATIYDASCNGTWLLMKDIYITRVFGTNNYYSSASVRTYLNDAFLNLLDAGVQESIKEVAIPVGVTSQDVVNDANKIFLPSMSEVGILTGNMVVDGSRLEFFSNITSDRIAYLDGTATSWWLRTRHTANSSLQYCIANDGASIYMNPSNKKLGVRPLAIFDAETLIDEDFNIIIA